MGLESESAFMQHSSVQCDDKVRTFTFYDLEEL